MGKVGKLIIAAIVIMVVALFICARTHTTAHAETIVGSGYDRTGTPFTTFIHTQEGSNGTAIINGGSGRTGITYIYGAGSEVKAKEREQGYWTANPLGKGFNK